MVNSQMWNIMGWQRITTKKTGARIDIQPRFKIQYPMKNRDKDSRMLLPAYTPFVVYG